MAIMEPGPLAGRIVGSIGGITFTNQKGKQIITQRQRHCDKKTNKQLAHRALVAQRAQEWRDLTDSQRADWEAAASTVQGPVDTFGTEQNLAAFNFFMWQRTYPSFGGFPPLDTPLSLSRSAFLEAFEIPLPESGPWTVTSTLSNAGPRWVGPIYCARSMRNVRPKVWKQERLVRTWNWLQASPQNLYDQWVDNFGAPIVGEWLRFRAVRNMTDDHFKNQSIYYVAQVTADP